MSRKDYRALAGAIRQNITSKNARRAIAEALIPALRADNPRFDSARFIDAAVGE